MSDAYVFPSFSFHVRNHRLASKYFFMFLWSTNDQDQQSRRITATSATLIFQTRMSIYLIYHIKSHVVAMVMKCQAHSCESATENR